MSPRERRNEIIRRQIAGGFSDFDIIRESGYQGYRHYKGGTDATDVNVYSVEQALGRLEVAKK
jgi:hypothetical protein